MTTEYNQLQTERNAADRLLSALNVALAHPITGSWYEESQAAVDAVMEKGGAR